MKKLYTTIAAATFAFAGYAQTFDTTGLSNWSNRYNSYETWEQGAFDANRDASNPADFGWGEYDQLTHIIEGDSIYIIKTVNDNYKAISIDQLVSGTYTITYSNLDGSGSATKTLDRSAYNTKNFFFYSLDNEVVKDLEPATDSWDIVFTKYLTIFPGFGGYAVSGVLHNRDVQMAQVETMQGTAAIINDTVQYPFSTNISTAGYDWKDSFNGIIYDTLTYFVKDQIGNINEVKFIGYGGSATGKFVFTVNGVTDSISLSAGNENQVYYSLQNASTIASNTDNDWDIALFAQSSFESIPVRINEANGADLYIYPKADISYLGNEESRNLNVLSVYPNPAKDQVNIVANANESGNYSAQLIDQSGRTILVKEGNLTNGFSEVNMPLTNVPAGIYILQFSQNNTTATTRVVVQP